MTEQEHKDYFDERANDPQQWLKTAEELLAAADAIDLAIEQARASGSGAAIMNSSNVSLMNRAFAVECLLKRIYVATDGKMGHEGQLPRGFPKKAHDVLEMWERLPLLPPLDKMDRRRILLNKLTDVATSFGRFPVATKWQKDLPEEGNARFQYPAKEEIATLVQELKDRVPR